jgi:hypothetical protein
MAQEWHDFKPYLSVCDPDLPPVKKPVLVRVMNLKPGASDPVCVGYLKYHGGEESEPYFVIPGCTIHSQEEREMLGDGRVLQWCDCLPEDFEWYPELKPEQVIETIKADIVITQGEEGSFTVYLCEHYDHPIFHEPEIVKHTNLTGAEVTFMLVDKPPGEEFAQVIYEIPCLIGAEVVLQTLKMCVDFGFDIKYVGKVVKLNAKHGAVTVPYTKEHTSILRLMHGYFRILFSDGSVEYHPSGEQYITVEIKAEQKEEEINDD